MHVARLIVAAAALLACMSGPQSTDAREQDALTAADLQWIIGHTLIFRSQMAKDTISVDACSAFKLIGADSARYESMVQAVQANTVGDYGPNCRPGEPRQPRTLLLQQVHFTSSMADSIARGADPSRRVGVATVTALVRGPVIGGRYVVYTETYVFAGFQGLMGANSWGLSYYIASQFTIPG